MGRKFPDKMLFIFHPSESVLEECKKMDMNRNFVLFPNMSSEILCLFLFASSERIFERLKKLVWTEIFFVHFGIFTLGIQNWTLKLWFIYQIVERILPYRMHYFSFFVFSYKASKFLFSYYSRFWKIDFFHQNRSHVEIASQEMLIVSLV